MRSLSTGHSLFNQNSKTDENKTQCSNASHIKTQAEDSSDYTTNESDIEEKFLSTASLLIIYINQVLDTFKETSVYNIVTEYWILKNMTGKKQFEMKLANWKWMKTGL